MIPKAYWDWFDSSARLLSMICNRWLVNYNKGSINSIAIQLCLWDYNLAQVCFITLVSTCIKLESEWLLKTNKSVLKF